MPSKFDTEQAINFDCFKSANNTNLSSGIPVASAGPVSKLVAPLASVIDIKVPADNVVPSKVAPSVLLPAGIWYSSPSTLRVPFVQCIACPLWNNLPSSVVPSLAAAVTSDTLAWEPASIVMSVDAVDGLTSVSSNALNALSSVAPWIFLYTLPGESTAPSCFTTEIDDCCVPGCSTYLTWLTT